MQSQKTQAVTSQQSLASVQTLLKAGLGCITFLRNLLPSDNFTESYLTSGTGSRLCYQSTDGDADAIAAEDAQGSNGRNKRNVSAFKVMTVMRGFTEEADRLLDYLEGGIFEAVQRQYLRSFIFAVYLDPKDPNSVVETYTFNFTYHTVPGSHEVIPVMSLGDELQKLALNGKHDEEKDPVANAAKKGQAPTIGEVKKSVKSLIKRLIKATLQMDPLPKRRYATFKLFYNDNAPEDYEPPHFHPGDFHKDKWFFATHRKEEVPEKINVGTLETGFHGVNVRIASVTGFLPSPEDMDAPFLGITPGRPGAGPTPIQAAALSTQQNDIQINDAADRNVVWDAEDGIASCDNADAEGEHEPDNAGRFDELGVESFAPIGIRNEDGVIEPMPTEMEPEKLTVIFEGVEERAPEHIGDLNAGGTATMITQTQQIEFSQQDAAINSSQGQTSTSSTVVNYITNGHDTFSSKNTTSLPLTPMPSLPPSDFSDFSQTQQHTHGIDTQNLMNDMMADTEMLDMETQVVSNHAEKKDPIESFGMEEDNVPTPNAKGRRDTFPDMVIAAESELLPEKGIECECHVSMDDSDAIMCEGDCTRWYHLWCMGYHCAQDRRIPAKFICFDCRVRRDPNWEMMKDDAYSNMLEKFEDLALFRRAIKISEKHDGPETLAKFTKVLGCEALVAGAIFRRLEAENFIATEEITTDTLGMLQTRTRTVKGKPKAKTKRANQLRKNVQKAKYFFNGSSKGSVRYADYFNPDIAVERHILGLSELRASFKQKKGEGEQSRITPITATHPVVAAAPLVIPSLDCRPQSQTNGSALSSDLKRKASTTEPVAKKVKISVGLPVDLED